MTTSQFSSCGPFDDTFLTTTPTFVSTFKVLPRSVELARPSVRSRLALCLDVNEYPKCNEEKRIKVGNWMISDVRFGDLQVSR